MPTLFKAISKMASIRNRGYGSADTSVLRNQFSAGLEYQIELQKFLVLIQNFKFVPSLAVKLLMCFQTIALMVTYFCVVYRCE